MKNKVFIIIPMLALVFTICMTSVSALGVKNEIINVDNTYTPEEIENNAKQTLLASKISDFLKDSYEGNYPSYLGGIYISEDSKNVVLQIVKDNLPINDSDEYNIYNKVLNMGDSIRIQYVNNSYDEIVNLNNKISDLVYINNNDGIVGSYIDVIKNKVNIKVKKNTSITQQNVLRKINNNANLSTAERISEMVIFTKDETEDRTTAINIKAGGPVDDFPFFNCSVGFRTTYGGKKGFVTAGHCLNLFNPSIPLGDIKVVQYKDTEYGDYGFIATSSSYNPTNDIYYSVTNATLSVTTAKPNIFVGEFISKSGRTTYITTGKITGAAYTATYGSVRIKGLYVSDLKVDEGDSGGVVMAPVAGNTKSYTPIGIVSGKTATGQTMFFTGLDYMPDAFRTGRY